MRLARAMVLTALLAGNGVLHAQDTVAGSYVGSYDVQTPIGFQSFGITVVISSIENGVVTGTATRHRGSCAGELPLRGKYQGNEISLGATAKGGKAGDCGFGFKGTVDGNRLIGKMGSTELVLRK